MCIAEESKPAGAENNGPWRSETSPPDIAELVRQGRDRLRRMIPSGSVAVVQRFGKYLKNVQPGLHFKPPLGIDVATIVPVKRQLKQEFGFTTLGASDRTVDEVITIGRQEIEIEALTKMQALSTKYEMGVSIDQVQLKSINPPATVQVSKGFVFVVNLASLRRGRELLELFYIPRGDRN